MIEIKRVQGPLVVVTLFGTYVCVLDHIVVMNRNFLYTLLSY